MAFNISGASAIPLSVLGGLVTEMAPTALPEGVSPDNQELMFLPGSAYSRPAFSKVFENPFPTGGPNNFRPTVVYGKSLVTSSGDIKNLWFDSNGILWVEDWSNSPGTYTQLFAATPGSFMQSITAFGREYIAISDSLHGSYPPLQYDGTFLDRLTQDGPGAPPTVTSEALPSVLMASSGNTLTRMNNQVLCATATAHGLQVGYQAQISNVPDSNSTDVVQTGNSTAQSTGGTGSTYWSLNSGQWRSNFNPGTSPLGAFIATGLGFTIPTDATILGVTATFGVNSQGPTTGTVNEIALWYSGLQEGTAKSPATPITTTITRNTYGSAGDLWGAALTPAIVNSPTFGFAISITCDSERVFMDFPFTVQVYYTLSGSGTVAQITSIVINNETFPGLALVTTTGPHGLVPGIDVSIVGVEPGTVANISSAVWSAGVTTLTTSTNHNLSPGSLVQVAGVTTATGSTTFSFNGTFTVDSVPSPNQVSYRQVPITATDPDLISATANTGSITISWPIPQDTPTPTYFTVESCPTTTTFYVQVSYSNGMWTTGTVGFIWEGTFYVTEVVDSTHFYYQQYGPNGATSAVGNVTPWGQCAPGLHLCQVLFLDRQGGITAPSPPATFVANGGQYVSVSNIPIGPPNIVARILQFTGAQPNVPGELPPFFYLPVPAQLEGQIVSTSTQINDNTTTSALLDFSDNSLFAAVGTSVTGNNLVEQIVLDGALGFAYWDSRLTTFGQRAAIQEALSLGFEGGVNALASTQPLGWTGSGGSLVTGLTGLGYALNGGSYSQSAYLDAYGDPIFDGNITYAVRALVQGTGNVTITLSSASTSFSATATLAAGATAAYVQANFSSVTPTEIPADLTLTIAQPSATVDEISFFDSQNPYLDNQAFTSYVNNGSAFDGVTGNMQPTEDTRKIMGFTIIRGTPYGITQDPSGRVHEITVNPTSEPSGWEWREVQANCGSLSAFGITHSQADDATASSGDDWAAWPTETGAGLFDGSQVHKVSQEIQPNWNPGSGNYPWVPANSAINMVAATTIYALDDPADRILYFFLPTGTATAPNRIYPLSYRELNSAYAIANSPPVHVSLGGKLIVTDNTRKWTRWLPPMNGAARMYRQNSRQLTTVFFGGNGQAPGAAAGFGNVYTLNPAKLTDDDFGQIDPYYVTFFGPDPEKAQALQLTAVRLLLAYCTPFISGVGNVTYSVFCDALSNPWPLTVTRTLTANPKFAQEFGGCQAMGSRMALKIASSPLTDQTDNSFNLQWLQFFYKNAKLKIRGAAQ